jgi:uncharacterized protein YgiM (DUF1202 family)
MRFILLLITLLTSWQYAIAQEYKPEYFGTVYRTAINDDKVNVRSLPSLDGTVLLKLSKGDRVTVRGVSEAKVNIGGYTAYWFELGAINEKSFGLDEQHWVFGQFVHATDQVSATTISFDHFVDATKKSGSRLFIKIHGKSDRISEVYPARFGDRDYYTFTWSTDDESYFYYDVPGTYLWYPKTNEIRHVMYLGNSGESAWVHFTDDFEYFIQDYGTSPGVRGMILGKTKTGKIVFSDGHLAEPEIKGHLVTFAVRYDDLKSSDTKLPQALRTFALTKMKTLPKLKKEGSLGTQMVIKYTVDADTLEILPVDCEYIYEQ